MSLIKFTRFLIMPVLLLMAVSSCNNRQNTATNTQQSPAATSYAGTYTLGNDVEKRSGTVYIYPETDTAVSFYIDVNIGAPSYNMGTLAGRMEIMEGRGIFRLNPEVSGSACSVEFLFGDNTLRISQAENSDCGFGNGVFLNDTFSRQTAEIPAYYTTVTGDTVYFSRPAEVN